MILKTISILVFGFFLNVIPPNPPKDLTVTGNIETWRLVIDCLDKSNDEHLKVKAAQEFIISQLNKQLSDTTKPKK